MMFWVLATALSAVPPALPDAWVTHLVSPGLEASDLAAGVKDARVASLPGLPARTASTWQLRKGQYLGKFKATFYWMVEEEAYTGRRSVPLYTTQGRLIGHFTPQFVSDFRMESCALLRDGRIISYMKKANRCEIVDAPLGINGYTLTELRSVAVDPNAIPVGSMLYIPDADEMPLTDGRYHSGLFQAHDIGSAIKGDRIDVYLGLKSNIEHFRSTSFCRGGYVDVYLLQ
jgi:3D (Asp-Asp-Asp) domain-containing protein